MRDVGERWGSRQLIGVCRASATGACWRRAATGPAPRASWLAAVGDLEASRPGQAPRGLARLGELRARQGRAGEARALLVRAGSAGVLGLGELALDAGDADGAADAAERVLRRLPAAALLTRIPALELLVRARAEQGRVEDAAAAYEELARAGAQLGTPYVVGRVRLAAARVAHARGDHDEARRAPRGRRRPAVRRRRAVRRRGRAARAGAGARRARAARRRGRRGGRGARGVRRARRRPRAGARRRAARRRRRCRAGFGELSPREVEVLRLVAQGLSATPRSPTRLVLSPHTVHRHVANVRTKLRLPSRTAAVAYAARAGLL